MKFTKEVFAIRRSAKADWMKATLSDEEAETIAKQRYQRSDTFKFEKAGQSLFCKCLGDPRVIQTDQGPWEVLDIQDQKGDSYLLSLGHMVLAKAVKEKMAKLGSLTGKVLVILYLGQPKGKRYYDYVVKTWEEFQAAKK